jgi:hypothetical protein
VYHSITGSPLSSIRPVPSTTTTTTTPARKSKTKLYMIIIISKQISERKKKEKCFISLFHTLLLIKRNESLIETIQRTFCYDIEVS